MSSENQSTLTGFEIAVIGMAGRFPGAKTIDEFWENLKNGIESVTFFSDRELEEVGVTPGLLKKSGYVKAKAIIEDIEYFDAFFFGYTPKEAELLDPQVRIFHECAWEAVEDAGYHSESFNGLIGLFAGASTNFYWQALGVLSGKTDDIGFWAAAQLMDKDFLSLRTAYKLGLKGPAVELKTACSTSLAAIHMACQAILNGECDMALAGGVTVSLPQKNGYMFSAGMVMSPDGHCRAFTSQAAGIVAGDGIGIVVLKRLEDALSHRDHIYGVVKGSAMNNDGTRKVGFSAPAVEGQSEVIRFAQKMAHVEPETIGYLETHGTGTELGDLVEIEALKLAFNTTKKGFCSIGSIKTNIGHLDAAAGAAGFIKTVLALKHRLIPPSLHFEIPNPKIDFENSPFYVNRKSTGWKRDSKPRRAGVSSFGIGGTNVHIILEEFPGSDIKARTPTPLSSPFGDYQLILLSARTSSSLDRAAENLSDHLKRNPNINLADAAYTLQVGRKAFGYRRMLVAATTREVIDALTSGDTAQQRARVRTSILEEESNKIVFMFAGLGSQYVNMGREIYEKEPLFQEEMDRCFEILTGLLDYDVKDILYPTSRDNRSYKSNMSYIPDINQPEITQLVIFIIEYALAKLLMTWGIKPKAMIGYSFGEYAAACLAGIFSLEDALRLIVSRGRLMRTTSPGAMLSVPLPYPELKPLLDMKGELSAAIDNGPSCIVSGPAAAVDAFEKQMKEKKLICVRLQGAHAFHSKLMEPILKEFAAAAAGVTLNQPRIPYISNVTGDWLTDREAADPAYWARHLRETVQFAEGIKKLVKDERNIFVEIGPGRDLSTMVRRYLDDNPGRQAINLIRHPQENQPDVYFLLKKIGRLWLSGINPDWSKFYKNDERYRIPLPTYPFDRQYYWLEVNQPGVNQKLGGRQYLQDEQDVAHWFYQPSWKRVQCPGHKPGEIPGRFCWLVFIDDSGLGVQLTARLLQQAQQVITVKTGPGFLKEGDPGSPFTFTIDPHQDENYDSLFKELKRWDMIPDKILHLWGVTIGDCDILELGFYSLVNIARAAGAQDINKGIRVTVVTNNMQEVTGEEEISPSKATILGPVKVIPTEYSNIYCRSIDIVLPGQGSRQEKKLVNRLIEELAVGANEPVIAYRGSHRWVQTFEPIQLENPGTESNQVRLREEGVYLVTGGLGGIGLELAEYLAKKVRARLVLTGRTGLPPREQWDRWVSEPGKDDTIKNKIRKMQELESFGAKVLALSADVADQQQMQAAMARAAEQFGPLNGVIHAAGLADGQMIQRRKRENSQAIFAPKITGTLVLDHLLKNQALDFFILCSALNAILPMFGQVAYCAANAFLDAYATYSNIHDNSNTLVISINWDRWQGIGIARIAESLHKDLTGEDLTGGITREQAVEVFNRILANTFTRPIVSRHDLGLSLQRAYAFKASSFMEEVGKKTVSKTAVPRPELDTEYMPPRNETEQKLVNILSRYFGFEQIGILDDFFELGGDSLKAMTFIANIHKETDVRIPMTQLFATPTIRGLAEYISAAAKSEFTAIAAVEEKEYYALSSAQERLFIIQQNDPGGILYNMPNFLDIAGPLDREKLETCFRQLIKRHESLRTSFEMIDGEPVQKIHRHEWEFKIEYYDFEKVKTGVEDSIEEGRVEGWKGRRVEKKETPFGQYQNTLGSQNPKSQELRAENYISSFIRPFDLSRSPLLRVGLIKENENKHILLVDINHIVSDELSNQVLVKEFSALYHGSSLPPLKLQYKDFSEWQNRQLNSGETRKQEEFWKKEFAGEVPVLRIPIDFPRPELQSFEGSSIYFEISGEQSEKMRKLAAREAVTMFTLVLALYNVLLAKLSGQEDIVVGTVAAGRRHENLEPVIGMFVNTLALRNYPHGPMTFPGFLKTVNHRVLAALDNQDYQFEDLVEKVLTTRDISRNPLFDVVLTYMDLNQNQPSQSPSTSTAPGTGLKVSPFPGESAITRFDLILSAEERPLGLYFVFYYRTRLFKKETVARFADYFKEIISAVLENKDIKLEDITMSHQLSAAWSEEYKNAAVGDFEF